MLAIKTDGTLANTTVTVDETDLIGVKKINFKTKGDEVIVEIAMPSAVMKGGKPKLKTETLTYPTDVERMLVLNEFWANQEEDEEETEETVEEEEEVAVA